MSSNQLSAASATPATKKQKLVQFIRKYSHAVVLLYGIVYMQWFTWVESRSNIAFHVIHTTLDEHIPFVEAFIIPYMLWFGYIAITLAWFFFKSRQDFLRCCAFMFTGMTVCLIIYTLWPNMQDLRPKVMPRDNIFTAVVAWLYSIDTPTNVSPSIHVFNSISAYIAIARSETFGKYYRPVRAASLILTILISLSTMFLKQHSIFDVFCAIILSAIMYALVYVPEFGQAVTAKDAPAETAKTRPRTAR